MRPGRGIPNRPIVRTRSTGVVVDGSATGAFVVSAAANGEIVISATVHTTFVVSGVAAGETVAGTGTKQGAAAGTLLVTGTATARLTHLGNAQSSFSLAGSASPSRTVFGEITGRITVGGVTLGTVFVPGAPILTTPAGAISDADLLNATIAAQKYTFRFELLDTSGRYIGDLAIDRDQPPSITNDSTSPIRRTLDGVRILPRPRSDRDSALVYADDETLDVLRQRIRVSLILETGNGYPLGSFWWADDSRAIATTGLPHYSSLVDGGIILTQALERTLAFSDSSGVTVSEAMEQVARQLGITNTRITPTETGFAAPVAFVPGRDTYLTFFEAACALLSYLPPYFGNDGALVCRPAPEPTAAAELHYGAGTRVVRDSLLMSSTLLQAPNRYVVVDSASLDAPLVGMYDIPDAAPHSFTNRGIRVVRTDTVQGLTDQTSANEAAYAAYIADASASILLSFNTPPDPRHDTFTTIDFDGDAYQELRWSLECKAGGTMNHEVRRVYSLGRQL